MNMPEGLRPQPLAASRTRSLIAVRRHPPAAAKRAPLRPVQNNPRGFGPEIPIQQLAGRGCQTWRGRVLPLVYRNKHSARRKVQKILQRKFPQHFLGQTAFPNSFSYRGAFWAGLLLQPAGRAVGGQADLRGCAGVVPLWSPVDRF